MQQQCGSSFRLDPLLQLNPKRHPQDRNSLIIELSKRTVQEDLFEYSE